MKIEKKLKAEAIKNNLNPGSMVGYKFGTLTRVKKPAITSHCKGGKVKLK